MLCVKRTPPHFGPLICEAEKPLDDCSALIMDARIAHIYVTKMVAYPGQHIYGQGLSRIRLLAPSSVSCAGPGHKHVRALQTPDPRGASAASVRRSAPLYLGMCSAHTIGPCVATSFAGTLLPISRTGNVVFGRGLRRRAPISGMRGAVAICRENHVLLTPFPLALWGPLAINCHCARIPDAIEKSKDRDHRSRTEVCPSVNAPDYPH